MEKKLFLLDAYALIYRAYYAFIKNPRINSKGLNTSAIYGFINTLDEILKNEKPTHIAVVFDPNTPTFRHEMYPDYKAQRPPTPEGIKDAVPYIKEILRGFNIPSIVVDGYEADDTIGTMAKMAEKEGFTVYMMTPDKDYCQLVSENIKLYKPTRSRKPAEVWGLSEVKANYSIEKPEQFIEILTLWGDTSDNIPGVPGVGEKTAIKLISKYKTIEGVYKNINKLKGKQKENILKSKELLEISRKLVTIALDVPVKFNEDELKLKPYDKEALIKTFTELEFKSVINRLFPSETQTVQTNLFGQAEIPIQQSHEPNMFKTINDIAKNYHLIDNTIDLKKLIEQLQQQPELCFDTETTSLNTHDAELVGIAFSTKKDEAFFVFIPEIKEHTTEYIELLKPLLENEQIAKIGQNLKYDIEVLKNYNIQVKGKIIDTMLAHYLLHPEQKHNLDSLSEKYLNYQPVSIETLIGKKGKQQLSMRAVKKEKLKDYACEDADLTLQLKTIFIPKLKQENLLNLFDTIENPLVYVLADMEYTGVKIDTETLKKYAKELTKKITQIEKEIIEMAGVSFNIASPKQLGEVLFDKMKIVENAKKTKTKQYSTSEQELQKIADKHPIITKILEYRSYKKLLSTYVESLPELINKKTEKIHTSYNQAVTTTGRLTSTHPNLQNIPIKTQDGREIRKAFIPSDENYQLLSADYSQIELRLMAHFCNDENMRHAFQNKLDIHTATASKIFNVSETEVTKEMRSKAKSANFGIIYGISAFGLSQNLNVSRSEAKELIDNYFKSYPKIKEYIDQQIQNAREKGYVETLSGRKRNLPDINSQNSLVRGIAERNAINAPIQGTAADIIKIAMINVYKEFTRQKLQSKLIMQVHDELIVNAHKNEIETVSEIIKNCMENAYQLNVPLTIEMGVGKNWLEAH